MVIALLLAACLTQSQPAYDWKPYTIGTPKLSIDLPGEPKPVKQALKAGAERFIKKQTTLQVIVKGLFVLVSFTDYNDDVEMSLTTAASGFLQNMKEEQGVREVKYHAQEKTVGGNEGLHVLGSYKKGASSFTYDALFIACGATIVQVSTGHLGSSTEGREASKRIFASLKFLPDLLLH